MADNSVVVDLYIKNRSVVTDDAIVLAGTVVNKGKILQVVCHAYFNQPGRDHWVGYETGTKVCAGGSVNNNLLTDWELAILAKIDRDELIALLQALIRTPSDHQSGDCREAIQVVQDKLAEARVGVQIHIRNPLQPNLLASYGVQSSNQQLLYHAHIDTVPAGERSSWAYDPFGGEIHNGRI